MNKTRATQGLSLGLLFLIAACQAAGQPLSAGTLGPGDALEGMNLATGAADAPPLWAFCSSAQAGGSVQAFDCRVPLMPTLAVGHIFLLAEETLASLSASDLVWELAINGRDVDLESFGTFDYVMPGMSERPSPVREVFRKSTAWNIVLTNLSPGEHTLRFLAYSATDTYSWLIHLVIEEAGGPDLGSGPTSVETLNPRHIVPV